MKTVDSFSSSLFIIEPRPAHGARPAVFEIGEPCAARSHGSTEPSRLEGRR